ncbi:hypothetical protein [Corynebacterium lujinxingii]|uniref:Uncharacterized protein n=1 Tax=Corynebacterium lujinxingii TaxID=2763010 RepID=A0A7H0K0K2_9CORY|nr:hypothetical protein [Corynebacterium lujinxingii]MBC3179438.1 hypothetical protein [Corynebacterium lujinxingii]NNO11543.1 hypothetical protein [Corynebacterium lujinxingii]QNP90818.1 hypothetical protein IAU68_03385 [Corynebacterium lujinxingii]
MRRKLAVVASVFALAGCGAHGTEMGLQDAALSGDFIVADVAGSGVERAYVFCPYTDKTEAQRLGFDPSDVPGIDDNLQAWETASGIGVIAGGRAEIEWFDPRRVDACGPGVEPYQEIDPVATVHGSVEPREYASGEIAEVIVLRFE